MEQLLIELTEENARLRDELAVMQSDFDTLDKEKTAVEVQLDDVQGDLEDTKDELVRMTEQYDDLRGALDKFLFEILGTYNPSLVDFTAKGLPTDLTRELM